MRGKLKLLCFLIISFFMIGIGGAKAKIFYHDEQPLAYRTFNVPPYRTSYYRFYDENGVEAWCLNSGRFAVGGYDLAKTDTSLIPAEKKAAILNILDASKRLNVSDNGYRYYLTQAAIWYTLYGTDNDNGITSNFLFWLQGKSEWYTLINSTGLERYDTNPQLTVSSQDYTLTPLTTDDGYLYSKDFTINSEGIDGKIVISVSDGSSENSVICEVGNDENCGTSIKIAQTSQFKIKVANPGGSSGSVHVKFNVKPETAPVVSDIDTYWGIYDAKDGYSQNIGILVTKPVNLQVNQIVSGDYENNIDIRVQKIDKDTGTVLAGAVLYIEDEQGNRIGTYETTASGSENISLPVGKYKLGEVSAPQGYYYNSEQVSFEIKEVGGIKKVFNKNNEEIIGAIPVVSFENSRKKVKFRKVDDEGNPIEGVILKITAYASASTGGENSTLCAISDAQGYLTQNCTGSDNTGNARADGEYTLGIDFGAKSDLYIIREICPTDNAKCQQYVDGGEPTISSDSPVFYALNYGSSFQLYRDYLSISKSGDSASPVITLTITNKHYIRIKKTDITGSNEVKGATLTVLDLEKKVSNNASMSQDNVVDEWESGNNEEGSHKIVGIIPGRKYQLIETLPADGYTTTIDFAKNVNKIDFIMDENGNITTYDSETGEPIKDLTGSKYMLIVKNNYTKTEFSKTSAVTGEEIAGATLKVCTEESYNLAKKNTGDGNNCAAFERTNSEGKKEVISWVSEKGKSKTIEALPAGKYYLVEEIAPVGYVKQTNSAAFEVKADGTITKVEMKNEPTKVTISKKDVTTGEEVPGAQIKICTAESYKKDGKDCKPDSEDLAWTSGTEAKVIEALPFGDYVLIETLPAPDYQEGMIIDGDLMTAYEFSISQDNGNIKIDVYNQVLTKVPSTGISTLNLFAIGGLMVFAGYETIKIYRRKALNN